MTNMVDFWCDPVAETHRPYAAAESRYASTGYRQVGNSGLMLPPLSLGLWWNFGDNRPFDTQRQILRHAFDHGIMHFDLANNYGPPFGSAEENFGRMMSRDFAPYRDELVISSKAGWHMWPGPHGNHGSRKYLIASAEASLKRMNLDYVDIFYSHRPSPHIPVEETVGALDTLVRQGKALYVGISSYDAEQTTQAARVARELGTPLTIHQPAYNLLKRDIEAELLPTLQREGMGSIAFVPLSQGLLTNKYLDDRDATPQGGRPVPTWVTEEKLAIVRDLANLAAERGQSVAQLALSWLLRDGGVTSALIGASSIEQLDENLGALGAPAFTAEELARIDALTLPPAMHDGGAER